MHTGISGGNEARNQKCLRSPDHVRNVDGVTFFFSASVVCVAAMATVTSPNMEYELNKVMLTTEQSVGTNLDKTV